MDRTTVIKDRRQRSPPMKQRPIDPETGKRFSRDSDCTAGWAVAHDGGRYWKRTGRPDCGHRRERDCCSLMELRRRDDSTCRHRSPWMWMTTLTNFRWDTVCPVYGDVGSAQQDRFQSRRDVSSPKVEEKTHRVQSIYQETADSRTRRSAA